MKKINEKDVYGHIGPRIKFCFIVVWGHLMYLTWLMLTLGAHPVCQALSLALTIVSIYLQVVLMADYFYLKTHVNNKEFQKDVTIIKQLLPERFNKNDKQA